MADLQEQDLELSAKVCNSLDGAGVSDPEDEGELWLEVSFGEDAGCGITGLLESSPVLV